MQPLAYLATPFSRFPRGLDAAHREAVDIAERLHDHGVRVYSPIKYSHIIARDTGVDPIDHNFWLPQCELWFSQCDRLLVATMDGWRDSVGISYEICAFNALGKPIALLDPWTLVESPYTQKHL